MTGFLSNGPRARSASSSGGAQILQAQDARSVRRVPGDMGHRFRMSPVVSLSVVEILKHAGVQSGHCFPALVEARPAMHVLVV